jgi:hypothetical protein
MITEFCSWEVLLIKWTLEKTTNQTHSVFMR